EIREDEKVKVTKQREEGVGVRKEKEEVGKEVFRVQRNKKRQGNQIWSQKPIQKEKHIDKNNQFDILNNQEEVRKEGTETQTPEQRYDGEVNEEPSKKGSVNKKKEKDGIETLGEKDKTNHNAIVVWNPNIEGEMKNQSNDID
ncbi:hypothetical protein HAX54_020085, partial [Datura stramonium]|nr:hypothetical protein [Datura stramonium]